VIQFLRGYRFYNDIGAVQKTDFRKTPKNCFYNKPKKTTPDMVTMMTRMTAPILAWHFEQMPLGVSSFT
jgi:hypothetical protein